jgi:hypothetical protein
MTDFVLHSAEAAAERTIENRAMLVLTARETEAFADASERSKFHSFLQGLVHSRVVDGPAEEFTPRPLTPNHHVATRVV